MSDNGPDERYQISRALESADREIRMERMREELEARGGVFGMDGGDAGEVDSFVGESFLENILRFEEAPETTHAKLLIEDGVELPPPGELGTAERVETKLWEVINALAFRSVYLYHTDHLSDLELYEALWREHLNEMTKDLSNCPRSACHMDLLCDCGDEDNYLFLRYYADEKERAYWSRDWPGDEIPDHAPPPYDRDRHLPKRDY